MYLKPTGWNSCGLGLLLFFDVALTIFFQVCHLYFFLGVSFNSESDHVLKLLLTAFSGFILLYAYTDGVRFLRSNFDKILYLISCCLLKPIFLPILFPSRFRSRIARKYVTTHSLRFERKTFAENGVAKEEFVWVRPTKFLLAV